jgi:hypothetical protein
MIGTAYRNKRNKIFHFMTLRTHCVRRRSVDSLNGEEGIDTHPGLT